MSDRELEQYMKLLALNLLALTAILLKLMEEEERFSWFKLKEPRKKITTPEVKRAQNEKAKKEVRAERENR